MSPRAIREMVRADIPAIMEIERVSFPTPWTMGMFAMQLAFKDRTLNLVLEEDGFIGAYAALSLAFDEMHLLSIAVAPELRRRGFAKALLDEVLTRGRSRGTARIVLEVREGNEAARAFYRGRGFVEIGRRRRYYSDTGEDAIVMEYELHE